MRKSSGTKPVLILILFVFGILVAYVPSVAKFLYESRVIHFYKLLQCPPVLAVFFIIPAFALRTTRLPAWYRRPLAVMMLLTLLAVTWFKPFSHDLWRYHWDNSRMAPLACCFIASLLLYDMLTGHKEEKHEWGRLHAVLWALGIVVAVFLFEMLPWLIPTQDHSTRAGGIFLFAVQYVGIGSLIALIWHNDRWRPRWLAVTGLVVSILPLVLIAIAWTTGSWAYPYLVIKLYDLTNVWLAGIYAALFGMGVKGLA